MSTASILRWALAIDWHRIRSTLVFAWPFNTFWQSRRGRPNIARPRPEDLKYWLGNVEKGLRTWTGSLGKGLRAASYNFAQRLRETMQPSARQKSWHGLQYSKIQPARNIFHVPTYPYNNTFGPISISHPTVPLMWNIPGLLLMCILENINYTFPEQFEEEKFQRTLMLEFSSPGERTMMKRNAI